MAAIWLFAKAYFTWVMKNLVNVAITVGFVVAIVGPASFMSGWSIKGKFTVAKAAERIVETTVVDANAVVQAHRKGEILAGELTALKNENNTLRGKLKNAIPATPAVPYEPEVDTHASCPAPHPAHLSVYAVGVLNRALDGSAPDPEKWSDEEKRAASENGLREVSDKVAAVALSYHELAKAHDGLVDDVAAFQIVQLKNRRAQQ